MVFWRHATEGSRERDPAGGRQALRDSPERRQGQRQIHGRLRIRGRFDDWTAWPALRERPLWFFWRRLRASGGVDRSRMVVPRGRLTRSQDAPGPVEDVWGR